MVSLLIHRDRPLVWLQIIVYATIVILFADATNTNNDKSGSNSPFLVTQWETTVQNPELPSIVTNQQEASTSSNTRAQSTNHGRFPLERASQTSQSPARVAMMNQLFGDDQEIERLAPQHFQDFNDDDRDGEDADYSDDDTDDEDDEDEMELMKSNIYINGLMRKIETIEMQNPMQTRLQDNLNWLRALHQFRVALDEKVIDDNLLFKIIEFKNANRLRNKTFQDLDAFEEKVLEIIEKCLEWEHPKEKRYSQRHQAKQFHRRIDRHNSIGFANYIMNLHQLYSLNELTRQFLPPQYLHFVASRARIEIYRKNYERVQNQMAIFRVLSDLLMPPIQVERNADGIDYDELLRCIEDFATLDAQLDLDFTSDNSDCDKYRLPEIFEEHMKRNPKTKLKQSSRLQTRQTLEPKPAFSFDQLEEFLMPPPPSRLPLTQTNEVSPSFVARQTNEIVNEQHHDLFPNETEQEVAEILLKLKDSSSSGKLN